MSQALSISAWRRHGPLASRPQLHRSVVPEVGRIDAGPIHLINILCPAGLVADPPVPEYAVHLVLRTPPLLQVGFNRRARVLVMSPGVLLAAPPDTAGDFDAELPSHVLTIAIPKAHVEDFTRDSGAQVEVRREETFRAPRLARQIVRLWRKLVDDEPATRMFADQVMREVIHVLALRTDTALPVRHARERLSPFVLRRLCDYVESSLSEDLDVTTMAKIVALSPAHFARAFAATVGMTPFRYVISRRLARAHELLERTDRSALDIALGLGFKTPSHFTSRFRREFGVTPREVRSETRRPEERLDLEPLEQ